MFKQFRKASLMVMLIAVTAILMPFFQSEASAATKTLTIVKTGGGTGTVTSDIAGINCDSGNTDCTEAYNKGTRVVLTAAPDADARFKGWYYLNAFVSKNSAYSVKMDVAKTIKAKFLKTYNVTITNSNVGTGTGGTVTASGLDCGVDCTGTYIAGKTITFTAQPDSDSKFTGWSGDVTKTKKTVDVTITGDLNITATFDTKATGMQIAEKVSVVDTSSSPGGQAMKAGDYSMSVAFPVDSDYNNDATHVYVNERATDTFSIVNEILCMIGQTKYADMVNKGNYKAQIDTSLCSSDNDDPSSAGEDSQNQSSGSTMPEYELWTINSSRADDTSPQVVKVWIHESGDDMGKEPPKAIFAKTVITEEASSANPYGIFTLNFKMYPEINGVVNTNTVVGKGLLKTEINPVTGKVLLKFVDLMNFNIPGEGPAVFSEKATLDRAVDGSTGGGTVYNYESFPGMPAPEEESFDFAFNQTNFLRVDEASNSICMDRTTFDETAWRYGLYDSNGARLNRDSGFPIKKVQSGVNYYGWIGYYGIWFPKNVTLNNGDQVYKMDFGPGGSEDIYNVLIAGGKLKKHTQKIMLLGDIKNVPMDYWDQTDNLNYRIKWDGTDFVKYEYMDNAAGDYLWKKLTPQVPYDTSNLNFDMLNFWSQALGGNVQIKLNCSVTQTPPDPPVFSCTADDTLQVVFYAQSVVFPSDPVPASFACLTNCPDTTKISTGDQWPYDNTYEQPQGVPPSSAQYLSYDFDSSQMVLNSNGTPVLATSAYQWGVMSGPLFDPTPGNLALLACDWDSNQTCGWKSWNALPEYYTWETGSNEWNKFTALVDPLDGSVMKFDPPMQVSYLHTWADLSTSMFNLEYSGFGNLWGIPGECIDWDSGAATECGPDTRWIPQFSITAGAEVTDVSDGVTKYYVKPLEMEQRMKEVNAADCASLSTTTYSLPTMSEWVDPNIGAEPNVTDAPAVIGGVIQ